MGTSTAWAGLIAARVAEAHRDLRYHDWVPLGSAARALTLAVRKPDEQTYAALRATIASQSDDKAARLAPSYLRKVQILAEMPDMLDVRLQVLRIGDLAIGAIPFETFAETGLAIKRDSPFERTFTIELAGGGYGYLPTPAAT